jgi:hypothetical protein
VVDVEHRRLRALEQHGLASVEGLVEQQRGVGDQRPEPVGVREELLDDGVDVDGAAVVDLGQQLVLHLERGLDLLAQDLLVEEVGDRMPTRLILSAYVGPMPRPVVPTLLLPRKRSVTLSIVGGTTRSRARWRSPPAAHVDAAGDSASSSRNSASGETTTRCRSPRCSRGEDAAGQQVGRELLAVDHDRVAGVVSAARATTKSMVSVVAEQVGGLALALVAPLGARGTTIAGIGLLLSGLLRGARARDHTHGGALRAVG